MNNITEFMNGVATMYGVLIIAVLLTYIAFFKDPIKRKNRDHTNDGLNHDRQ